MEKLKKLLMMLLELIMLVLLLVYLSHGGIGAVMGEGAVTITKVVIQFGVSLISLSGAVFGSYFPTEMQRTFRESQLTGIKYITVLMLYQTLMWFIGGTAGSLHGELIHQLPPVLINVIVLTFSMMAFMMPFNYVKTLFNKAKGKELRDPRDLVRQFFK